MHLFKKNSVESVNDLAIVVTKNVYFQRGRTYRAPTSKANENSRRSRSKDIRKDQGKDGKDKGESEENPRSFGQRTAATRRR